MAEGEALASYKFMQGLDDKLTSVTLLKFQGKEAEIRQPISNKRILAAIGIDDFCDKVIMNYKKTNSQKIVEEFNLYLKSRYKSLLDKNWISTSQRKVNF